MKKKETIEAEHSEALAKTKADNIAADLVNARELYKAVTAIKPPVFLSDAGIQLGADFNEAMGIVKEMITRSAKKL